MLNTIIPVNKYTLSQYANLDTNAIGQPIPIGYGILKNIKPTCIDTVNKVFKVLDQAIHSVDAVRTPTATLTENFDYTVDLALATITLQTTPQVMANTTYRFSIEADYSSGGGNYVSVVRNASVYSDGAAYSIDSGGTWSAQAGAVDLLFEVWGKQTLTSAEELFAQNGTDDGSSTPFDLHHGGPADKLGQSFKSTLSGYITRICFWVVYHGSTNGTHFRLKTWSNGTPPVQFGATTAWIPFSDPVTYLHASFPIRNENTDIVVDIHGPEKSGNVIVSAADVIEDMMENVLGFDASIIDATALADLATYRTQNLAIYIDREMTFGDFLGKMESSVLFKWIPLQDGTYAPTVFLAGEPANTPFLHDEDFRSFMLAHEVQAIKKHINVKYAETCDGQTFQAKDVTSALAQFYYSNRESLEIETYLVDAADALQLATDYLTLYQYPQILVTFTVKGYGLNLLPGRDKVKITRSRAPYTNGVLTAMLFRVRKITKNPATATTEITAQLDTQTYVP